MKVTNLLAEMEQQGIISSATRSAIEKSGLEMTKEEGKMSLENGASLQISEEAMQKYHELYAAKMSLENIRKQSDAAEEEAVNVGKVMLIFRRISKGDIVPYRDERKLMDYSTLLYQVAKMAQIMAKNDDPKKHKSVDDEEETDIEGADIGQATVSGGETGGAEISAPEVSSGE